MPYHQLVFELPAAELPAAEQACTRLGAFSLSLGDAGDEPLLEPAPGTMPLWQEIRLRALFPQDMNPALIAATLTATLGRAAGDIRVEFVADRVWEREWLEDFRPMRFGRRLWICPAGQPPDQAGAVVLELDPGLAFGTGTHPTTAACLEWLDGFRLEGLRVLDYGCGSGILALAALRLGASTAVAHDIDPQATLAAKENALKNAVDDRIAVVGSADAIQGAFDLVLANILAQPLIELAPRLAGFCRPGGSLVLAGMLERHACEVAEAYRPWFDIGLSAERDGWSLLGGRRRAE